MTCHQYGISAVFHQTLFHKETSCGVVKVSATFSGYLGIGLSPCPRKQKPGYNRAPSPSPRTSQPYDRIFILSLIVFSSANKSLVLDDQLHAGKHHLFFLLFSGFDFYKLVSAVILSCNGRCFRCFTYC